MYSIIISSSFVTRSRRGIKMMTRSSNQPACRRPYLSVFFLLSLLLLATFAAQAQAQQPRFPPPPDYPGGPPVYHVYWDVRTESFEVLRQKLMECLLLYALKDPYFPRSLNSAPVLGRRRANHHDAPPAWIYIHVKVGDAPGEQVTLAQAIDDLYILGFCNGAGVWYQFNGGFKGLPPGTQVLKMQENYSDLINGGRPNMPQVPLGKNSASHATLQLSTYDHRATPGDEAQAQDGLSRFVIMLGEGLRIRRIRETFSGKNWDKETFVSADDAKSVVDWGSSSRLMIRWFLLRGTTWGGGDYDKVAEKVSTNSKIKGMADAYGRYDSWLRPRETIPQLIS